MAGTSTVQNPELETETSRARAESIEAVQLEELGGTTLRLVGGTEVPAPTSETPPPDRFDIYMKNTAARFGGLGLVSIRDEIASVRSMGANVIGNDYLGAPYEPGVNMEERILGVVACCVVNQEDEPKEDTKLEDTERAAAAKARRHNEELDSIKHEGHDLYFDLVAGSLPQAIERQIDQFFEGLWNVELGIWQLRDKAHLIIPTRNQIEREELSKFTRGSLERKKQLQGAAIQMKRIIPIAL